MFVWSLNLHLKFSKSGEQIIIFWHPFENVKFLPRCMNRGILRRVPDAVDVQILAIRKVGVATHRSQTISGKALRMTHLGTHLCHGSSFAHGAIQCYNFSHSPGLPDAIWYIKKLIYTIWTPCCDIIIHKQWIAKNCYSIIILVFLVALCNYRIISKFDSVSEIRLNLWLKVMYMYLNVF